MTSQFTELQDEMALKIASESTLKQQVSALLLEKDAYQNLLQESATRGRTNGVGSGDFVSPVVEKKSKSVSFDEMDVSSPTRVSPTKGRGRHDSYMSTFEVILSPYPFLLIQFVPHCRVMVLILLNACECMFRKM